MFHSAEASVGSPGTDADLKALFDSLQVRQEDTRAVLIATLPTAIFHKLMESPDLPSLASPPSPREPEKSSKSKTH
jgi:hypothetical protein